jgi:ADP-ribosyl-[dinitrogen reductase] hydrolase
MVSGTMPRARTSLSHPLRIPFVKAGEGFGRVGISFCPGKWQSHAITGAWARELNVDLEAISSWGAKAVVTLVETHELIALRVEDLGTATADYGMRWFHLPIRDVTAPGPTFETEWATAGVQLRQILMKGEDIYVHCKGGLGRAGTIAARLLVELGVSPKQAIADVRAARPGAIQTREQEAYVLALTEASIASASAPHEHQGRRDGDRLCRQ